MQPTLKRAVRSLAAGLLTAGVALGACASAAHADAFQDRADQLATTFGVGTSYWTAYPTTSGTAQTEWKKGVFYSAMAVRRQEQALRSSTPPDPLTADARFTESVNRLDQGLVYAGSTDMFALSGLVDYWTRFPDPQPASQPAIWNSTRITKLQTALWARACWDRALTLDPQYTGNKRLMLYTAALFGARETTTVNNRPASSTCATPNLQTFVDMTFDPANPTTTYEGAKAWIDRFMRETVRYGFSEGDSSTYAGYYLAMLRLIADKYTADPAFADRAAKTFDWIVANNAGEWTSGSAGLTASTSRQYFINDGAAARPGSLTPWLRIAFGGTYLPQYQWEQSGDVRKPWAITAVSLSQSSWRPDARVVEAATDRSVAFAQRETTRMNLTDTASATPPLARSYRSNVPGLASMASTSSDPAGWGSQQAQEFTVRTQNSGSNTDNHTLALASPSQQTLASASEPSINGTPDLQWVQSGNAAVGALWSTTSPKLIRTMFGKTLLRSGTWTNNIGSSGWTILKGDDALIGLRFINAPLANGQLEPNGFALDDTWAARSNNPSGVPGNFVIVETAPYVDASSVTAFDNALTTRNASIICTGINLAPCTVPSAASRTTVQYTTLAGRVLKIGFPDTSGTPQRWIDGVLQSDAAWPVLENPWLQQNPVGAAGSDVLRASAVTGGTSTTTVTQYRVVPWTTTSGTAAFSAGASGGFETFSGGAPAGFQAANWSGAGGAYTQSTATKHTGSSAARVDLAGYGNAGYSLLAANRPTPTKQRATVTAWLKTTGVSTAATHGAYVWAQWVDAAGNGVCAEQSSDPVTGTSSWVSRSVTLQPKSSCAGAVKVAVSVRLRSNAGGSVVFDDLDWTDHD